MVGLAIRPIAELNHNRIEGLPKDGKEGRRGGKHFFFFFFFLRRDVIAVVEARGGERNIWLYLEITFDFNWFSGYLSVFYPC